MKDLLEKDNFLKPAQIGKIIEGKIVGKARNALFLDLGPLGTGIIYGREFQEAKNALKDLKTGDAVFAKVIDLENEDGYIELSLSQASNELTWEWLRDKKEKDEIITIKVLGANKGGLLAEVSGIPGFLPVSQLSPEHYPRVENGDIAKILKELQKFVGQELTVKIFDLDPRQGKLILSEKAKDNEKIKEMLKNYKVDDVVDGEITGATDFGAFIRFPIPAEEDKNQEYLEGLIHISELDWQLVEDPADIVKAGDKVKAKIISIIDDKVSLSLKALKEDPWKNIEEKYKKGDVLGGEVTKIYPYGAFVKISPQIQGLCHISEFGGQNKMADTIKVGEKYDFEILLISPKEHRMNLKLSSNK